MINKTAKHEGSRVTGTDSAGAAASEEGELEAGKSAGAEWVLRELLLALVRAGATFEAGKLVERPDEHPRPEAA